MEQIKCLNCSKKFKIFKCRIKTAKYCSNKCRGESHSYIFFGDKSPRWNGGKYIDKDGYVIVRTGKNKVEQEHRVIMAKSLKRKLRQTEIVHHINHDKSDNNISNLLLMTRAEHCRLHNPARKVLPAV